MNPLNSIFVISVSLLFTSCTNVTLLGHVVAYDVNAEFKGDPVVPVGMNAGFESRSFVAVPPKNAVDWKNNLMGKTVDQSNPYVLPKGDVLPTITKLRIEGIRDANALNNVAFDFISSGATGDAAIAAAGGKILSAPQTTGDTSKADKLAAQVNKISNNSESIPTP